MKIEEVKTFIEKFAKLEAHAHDEYERKGFEEANKALDEMHKNTVASLTGQMGLIYNTKNREPEFYERQSKFPANNPRQLFKISHYIQEKYGYVWVAYVSGINPEDDFKVLSYAFFVIIENGKLLIAKEYIYSNNEGMDIKYNWESLNGSQDLTFESLGKLVAIERYQEPEEFQDGLKLYNEEK